MHISFVSIVGSVCRHDGSRFSSPRSPASDRGRTRGGRSRKSGEPSGRPIVRRRHQMRLVIATKAKRD